MSGVIGILINAFLATIKIILGVLSKSIAMTADGVNNFFDATSSVVITVSSRVSVKEADAEHPYGHGRAEYIASLVIAFIIVLVGFELLKSSLVSLLGKESSTFGVTEMAWMAIAVIVKIWIVQYNIYVYKKYDSSVNRAVAQDAKNDVYGGLLIFLCFLLEKGTGYRFEAIGGMLLSGYIMFSGYHIAKDMVGILLGTSPTEETLKMLESILYSDDRIYSVHNWRMHDYGPGRHYCSVNVSMLGRETLHEAHALIDDLEQRVKRETGIEMTIHIDPVEADDFLLVRKKSYKNQERRESTKMNTNERE